MKFIFTGIELLNAAIQKQEKQMKTTGKILICDDSSYEFSLHYGLSNPYEEREKEVKTVNDIQTTKESMRQFLNKKYRR